MNIIDYFNSPVCVRFALALAHFLWQGLVIALLAVSLVSLLGKNASKTRYGVYVVSLLAMLLSLGVTYALVDVSIPQSAERYQADTIPIDLKPSVGLPEADLPEAAQLSNVSLTELPGDTKAAEAPKPTESPKFHLSLDWQRCTPYLISLYLLGVVVMLGRLLIGLQGGRRLRRFSEPVEDAAILASLGRQARALGLTFMPAIAFCKRLIVPTVVGVFKPTILLPFSFASGLSPQQVEMLLAHELAHIRRYDPFVNIGQRVIEALLFFHPAVWFISHRIRIERENCCDDIVLQTGGKATEYASSLVDIAQQTLSATGSKPCFATEVIRATGQPSRLGDRVRRLMGAPKSQQVRLKHTWVVGLVVSIFVIAVLAMANTKGDLDSQSEKEIEAIFEKADELSEQTKLRSREYLTSLSDDELGKVYARATAPQQPGGFDRRLDAALEKIQKDREGIITELVKSGGVFNEEDRGDFRRKHQKLVDELAALGPEAVPAIGLRMGDAYRRTGKWALAKKAIVKMGPEAVEPLLLLMDSRDRYIRENVTYVLNLLADPRAKDVLLRALDDESSSVRRNAIRTLIELGPEIVGRQKLVSILIDSLQDGVCLYESIKGLKRYGDETAIEALGIIERFHTGTDKPGQFRYLACGAQQAINAILRRAGKPIKEVSREDYQQKLSYEQMLKAAECPNAFIRTSAVHLLVRDKDNVERTALFLVERLGKEPSSGVIDQIGRSLYEMISEPDGSSEAAISAPTVQKAFDALLVIAEIVWGDNISVGKIIMPNTSVMFWDGDSDSLAARLKAATDGIISILYAADRRSVTIKNIDRFKWAIRKNLSLKRYDGLKYSCYRAITSISRTSEKIAPGWSHQERIEMQEQLAPLLAAPKPNIRLIQCLGYIGDERLVPRLIELLIHDDESIRRFAASALGLIGDLKALPELERLAETDPHQYENGVYSVRRAATEAIGKILKKQDSQTIDVRKQQDVNEKITNLLGELEKLENKHMKVRKEKLDSMSKNERKMFLMHNGAVFSGMEDELRELSKETAKQIAVFGEPAVPILLKELEALPSTHYRHYHRRCIARSLQQIDRPGVPYLIEALNSSVDTRNLHIIIDTLGRIGDKRAVEPIISELDGCLAEAQKTNDWNKQGWLMVDCAQALGRLNDKRAVGILKKALNAAPQTTKAGKEYLIAEEAAKALRSLSVDVHKQQDINEKITNLLGELEKLENEHETARENKWNNLSKEEKQKIMRTNMAISSGLEKDLDTLVRGTANRIAAFGEPAVPILLEELVAMSSEIHYQRLCITRSLRQIGRPGVPYLIASLNGQAPEDVVELGRYKHVIISTLGDMRDSRAVGPLLDLFEKNKTSKIRWTSSIASALGLIGDKQAVNPLIAELDASLKRAQETGDWNAGGYDMQACAEALGRLGDKRAIPSLKRALNAGPQGIKGGTQYLVAEEAAQALRALEVEVTGDREKGGYNVIEVAPTPE